MKLRLLCLLSFFYFSFANAQWNEVYQVEGDNIYQLFKLGNGQVIGTGERGRIYFLSETSEQPDTIGLQTYGFLASSYSASASTFYIGGGCYYTTLDCPANTIYKTTDGGISWEHLTNESPYGTGNVKGIMPATAGKIAIVEEYGGLFLFDENTGLKEAIEIPSPETPNYFSSGIASCNGKWAITFIHHNLGVSKTIIYETADMGSTWARIELEDENEQIYSIAYKEDFSLQILSSNLNLYRYLNGQLTYISNISQNEQEVPLAHYVVDNECTYISTRDNQHNRSTIYRTLDGGQTWDIDLVRDSVAFQSLAFTDRNNGWVASNFRKIFRREGPQVAPTSIQFQVFPNPVQDRLFISLGNNTSYYIAQVIDRSGKEVLKTSIENKSINISHLIAGTYFLRLSDEKGNWTSGLKFFKF